MSKDIIVPVAKMVDTQGKITGTVVYDCRKRCLMPFQNIISDLDYNTLPVYSEKSNIIIITARRDREYYYYCDGYIAHQHIDKIIELVEQHDYKIGNARIIYQGTPKAYLALNRGSLYVYNGGYTFPDIDNTPDKSSYALQINSSVNSLSNNEMYYYHNSDNAKAEFQKQVDIAMQSSKNYGWYMSEKNISPDIWTFQVWNADDFVNNHIKITLSRIAFED